MTKLRLAVSRLGLVGLVVGLGVVVGCGGAEGEGDAAKGAKRPASSGLPESALISRIQDAGVLKAGVATATPWLGRDPKTGEYFGPAVTIAEEAAKRLGVKLQYVSTTFDTVIAAVQSKQIDVALAPLFATPEREKVVDMVAYSTGGICYLAKKDNAKVNSLEDLKRGGLTLAAAVGTVGAQQTAAKYPKIKVITREAQPGEQVFYPELVSGKADVSPFNNTLEALYKKRYPDMKIIPDGCLQHPDIPNDVDLAFEKGDDGFRSFITNVIADKKQQLDAELKRYSAPKYIVQG